MQQSGVGSWSLRVDDGRTLNAACYIRDVSGMALVNDPSVPPRLFGVEVGSGPAFDTTSTSDWLRWWNDLLGQTGVSQPPTDWSSSGIARSWLTDDLWRTALHWAQEPHPPELRHLPPRRPAKELRRRWELEQAVAREVINLRGVTPSMVKATVVLVRCMDEWSHQPGPGVLVCSIGTWNDDALLTSLLRETFDRGVQAES
jgi:hypothetical protein